MSKSRLLPETETFLIDSSSKTLQDYDKAGDRDPGEWKKIAAFWIVGISTAIYVLAELGAALYIQSLTLLSDGFHNLSDVIAIYIAYWAHHAQKRDPSDELSFGWARTGILGGLINGSFLFSLSLYVALESIPRFIDPVSVDAPIIFMAIAGSGLVVNSIGTLAFMAAGVQDAHGHSHAGGGHGHSHGGGGHDHGGESDHGHAHDSSSSEGPSRLSSLKNDVNVYAVFLHYLGDTLSSLMVLISGMFMYFFDGRWTLYIDPVTSLIVVGLILATTVPLVKRCSLILLQSVPSSLDVPALRSNIARLEGVIGLHDFHLWQLVDGMFICSVHVLVEEGANFEQIADQAKRIFHEAGVHSSSIQPEFVPRNTKVEAHFCEKNCVNDCSEEWCCAKPAKRTRSKVVEYSLFSEL